MNKINTIINDNELSQDRAQQIDKTTMKQQELSTFDFQGTRLDYGILDGEPVFNLNAIGSMLGIKNPRTSIDVSDIDYVIKIENSVVGFTYNRNLNNRGELFLTESGLYKMLMTSMIEKAKPFQKWVTKEVLPSIRKNGGYIAGQENAQSELEIIANALILANNVIQNKSKELELIKAQMYKDKPKVEFAEEVMETSNTISIGDFAKLISNKKFKIGQNKLFEWLRNNRFLKSNNVPYQQYINNDWFNVVEQTFKINGEPRIHLKPVITGKGQVALTQKIKKAFR